MTVEMKTVEPGDTLHFANGGKHVVVGEVKHDESDDTFRVDGAWFSSNGERHNCHSPLVAGLNIIRIEKKPKPRQVVGYVGVRFRHDMLNGTYGTLPALKLTSNKDEKYYRLTFTEGQPPRIEEVE